MNSFDLHYVNHYEAVPGQGSQVRLTSAHPYVRLQQGPGAAIYIKEGVICGDNGAPLDETKLPPWFWDQARLMSPQAREAVKLVLPEERVAPAAKPKPKRTPVVAKADVPDGHWACTEGGCSDIIPIQKKGVHIAAHRRAAAQARKPVAAGAV